MIQLYKSTNTDYEMNGDYTLSPLSCVFECNLNDTWLLTIENPIDNSLEDFTIGAVVSAPTPYGDKQLFRIYDVTKDDNGISASAFPIFLDARNDCFLWDVRPNNVTGQTALNQMITNKKYSASSNIMKTSTAYYVQKNLIEALNGDDENAFLKRWGGEVAYNNYEIIVNDRIGSDNGLRVEFGFNLLGVSEQINNEDIVTRIIPKAYNGYILPNNETVDSSLINDYPIVYTRVIEYQDIKLIDDAQEDDAENGITVCNTLEELYAALRTRANKEFENGIDLPQITYNVDMVDLSKTDLYKDYKDLLKVNLGDTVHVKHRKLGIETSARVIRLTYDCIAKKVESLVLGDYEANYFNDVSSINHSASQVINTSNNTLMADKIAGIINLLNTSLRAQKDIAQKQDVRAILFEDLDPDSPTFGALCIGTQGIQIAKERNETNTDWQWGTAINFNSINADYMITGILTDKNGKFYLNLDTGELRMKDGNFVGNINGGNITGVNIIGSTFRVAGTRTYNVSSGDPDKIIQAIRGNYTPTEQEMMNWDIDNDGRLGASDMMYVERMLNGQLSKTFNVEIDLRIENNVPRIILRQYNSQKEFKTELSYGSLVTEAVETTRLNSQLQIKSNVITLGNDDFGYSFGHGEYEDSFGKKGKYIHFIPSWIDSKQENSEKVDYISFDGDLISGYMRMRTGEGNYLSNTYLFHDNIAGYMCLGVGDGYIDSYGGRLYLDFKDAGGTYDMYVRPRSNGKTTLGSTSYRFYRLYSSLSPDISSDRRIKEDFTQFDERYIKLFELLKPTIYKLKSLPDDKSKLAGFIAQDIEEAMNTCGINKREFGIYKYDEENDSYSLVYDMFIPLMIYYIQTKEKELNIFKDNIESRLSELEKAINNLSKGEA